MSEAVPIPIEMIEAQAMAVKLWELWRRQAYPEIPEDTVISWDTVLPHLKAGFMAQAIFVVKAQRGMRERVFENLKEDFSMMKAAGVNALKVEDVIRMIEAHKDHGPAQSVQDITVKGSG